MNSIAAFPGSIASTASPKIGLRIRSRLSGGVLNCLQTCFLAPAIPSAGPPSSLRHCICQSLTRGAGFSACCPSATPFGLALGPALPWGDQPSPGTLGLSVYLILANMSLLMPAFSLLSSPQHFTMLLLSAHYAPLPMITHPAASAVCLAPYIFGAGVLDQ